MRAGLERASLAEPGEQLLQVELALLPPGSVRTAAISSAAILTNDQL
jgi:hypothetical protein